SGTPNLPSVSVPVNTMDCPLRIIALSAASVAIVPRAGAEVAGGSGPANLGPATGDPFWTKLTDVAACAVPDVPSTTPPVAMTLRAAKATALGRTPRGVLTYTNIFLPARLVDRGPGHPESCLRSTRAVPVPGRVMRGPQAVHNRLPHQRSWLALLHSGWTRWRPRLSGSDGPAQIRVDLSCVDR